MTDKIMEARRAKFEPLAKKLCMYLERSGDGYAFAETQEGWEIFNAALDSLCVELPHIYEIAYHEEDGDGSWKAMTADRVIEAIHAAGVKTI